MRAVHPDLGVGEVAKQLGAAWGLTSPEAKSKYESLAENDKARYEKVGLVMSFVINILAEYLKDIN